jgi:hypothetical protein
MRAKTKKVNLPWVTFEEWSSEGLDLEVMLLNRAEGGSS